LGSDTRVGQLARDRVAYVGVRGGSEVQAVRDIRTHREGQYW
jgi:hypothetical protein